MSQTLTLKSLISYVIAAVMAVGLVLSAVTAVNAKKPANGPTLVDVASAANADGPYAEQFDTLLSLVTDLGLADVLSSNRPYTVFAPTDGAFEDLFAVVDPTTLSTEQLTDIVLYHVTNGKRMSNSVVGEKKLRMANGDFAMVSGATIDGANIIVPDITASNGVIHVVDKVLLP